jgi:predicted short-subunit dehydrogenase-like oxidoreductase (DUF2520 family)
MPALASGTMEVILVGPGRAGMSLGLALRAAGHRVTAVTGRGDLTSSADRLGADFVGGDDPLPPADLLVVAVSDGAIAAVAATLASRVSGLRGAIHLSGAVPVAALQPLAARGIAVGAFHPLQSFPDPDRGARAIPGSAVAITATDRGLHGLLERLAAGLGMRPFDLSDEHLALYHAAASMASNAVGASLWLAERLFEAAGVDPAVARPLVERVVEHSFGSGAAVALTGPVARGDMATVAAQIEAVRAADPAVLPEFLAAVRLIAGATGRGEEITDVLA